MKCHGGAIRKQSLKGLLPGAIVIKRLRTPGKGKSGGPGDRGGWLLRELLDELLLAL